MAVNIDMDTLRECDLKLWIYIKEEVIEKETSLVSMIEKKNILVLQPILVNDKTIRLDSGETRIVIVAYPERKKPVMYSKLAIKTIRDGKENRFFYYVQLTGNPTTFNRRNSFRCYVGEEVIVRIGINKTTYQVICRDISEHGFSLVFENDDHCKVGDTAHFVYNETVGTKETMDCQTYNLNLYGVCVRREELENGKILFGFRQFSQDDSCRKFVFHKERMALNKMV